MASAFSHIVIPAVLYVSASNRSISWQLFIVAALLSVLPYADVKGAGGIYFYTAVRALISPGLIALIRTTKENSYENIGCHIRFIVCQLHSISSWRRLPQKLSTGSVLPYGQQHWQSTLPLIL